MFADVVQVCRYKWGEKKGLGVYEQEDKAVQLLLLDAKRADKRIVKE